ncbi:MAG TPA: xylulokinase [Acetobacteraceae bacterium]|nr:xylulokinase [Acetobacteraceae bacterium]
MYLGIDLGTSSVKALLVDDDDAVLAEASAPLSVSRPHPGWSEQDPADWYEATLAAVDALRELAPEALGATAGIGLSGQMHGAVLLDAAHRVLRPCILWNDGRAAAECVELESVLRGITGNIVAPGFTAPKFAWVRKHEPDVAAATALVLLPKAYLRLKLSGEVAEEMSDASGTLWLDIAARDWSDVALAATGLSRGQMPRLVEGTAQTGRLRPELAARWGMASAPVIAGGAGDNAATAIGLGASAAGDSFVSLGTSGVLWATTDRFRPNPAQGVHAFCHALPHRWHQMGVILAASGSLEWWSSVCGVPVPDLVDEVGPPPAGPAGPLFLPYLSGERTPHNDAQVRGAFLGLGAGTSRAALTQAVLEGVAFAFRDGLDALQAAGTRIEHAILSGGGSRSSTWAAILAASLGIPLSRPVAGEYGAALGAARLGRMAVTGEDPAVVCRKPALADTMHPDKALEDAYAARLARYRAAYPMLKDLST